MISSYNLFSTGSKSNKGGVALYVKSSLITFERVDLKMSSQHFESVWLEIKNNRSQNILCGCIYRHTHNNSSSVDDFLEYMDISLAKVTQENKEVYICGDFNFDLLRLNVCNNNKKFFDLMCSYGLFHQITIPTRVTDNTATVIDNIYTNNVINKKQSGNIITDLSDHYSQFLCIDRKTLDLKSIKSFKRDFSNFSEESFRDDVSIQNFNNNFESVDEKFNDFYFKLAGCVDRHAPVKQLTPKQVKFESKPWISFEIQKMIRIRNNIFKQKKTVPTK